MPSAAESALLELTVSLGPRLTSTDVSDRQRALAQFADALTHTELPTLTDGSLAVVSSFLCGRLHDYPCASVALRALCTLIQAAPLTTTHLAEISEALLESTDVRSLPQVFFLSHPILPICHSPFFLYITVVFLFWLIQPERWAALSLTLSLCEREASKGGAAEAAAEAAASDASLGSSDAPLVAGVQPVRFLLLTLRAYDGEKDPRNLLLFLQLLATLCVRCDELQPDAFRETVAEVFESLTLPPAPCTPPYPPIYPRPHPRPHPHMHWPWPCRAPLLPMLGVADAE